MALAGGLSAQFGMAAETTVGTAVTPTRFLEFNADTLEQTIARIESSGLRPNRRVLRSTQWNAGRIGVQGDVDFEVNSNGFGLLFKAALGTIATSQPNAGSFPTVYEHKATVGATDGSSYTVQVAAGDTGGTVRAFTWSGMKIPKWQLSCDEGGFLMFKPTFDGWAESTAIGVAAAAYSATGVPLNYIGGSLTLGGVATNVKKFLLTGDNKHEVGRYFMRGAATSQTKAEQLESGLRAYGGSLDLEFQSLTDYNRFVNGTVAALTMFFEGAVIAGTYSSAVEVTLPAVRFDGKTPAVPGPGLIDVQLPFIAMDDGAGTGGVQIIYRTTDTTP